MNVQTQPTTAAMIKREWHLIDVKGQTLGRAATQIARLLMGKQKPYFVRYLDVGDYVVVINAKDVRVTGKKEEKKVYHRHSGYPGGYRAETLAELRERRPEEVVRRAVKGMLPDNRLQATMLKRLRIYAEDKHEYQDKFKV